MMTGIDPTTTIGREMVRGPQVGGLTQRLPEKTRDLIISQTGVSFRDPEKKSPEEHHGTKGWENIQGM